MGSVRLRRGVSRFGTAVNPSLGAAVENILFSRLPKRDTPAAIAEVAGSGALGERAFARKRGHFESLEMQCIKF